MKIFFADDHKMILDGLKNIIQEKFKHSEFYTALNKNELFELLEKVYTNYEIKKSNFDVLIQDVKFGKDNANDFITEIKNKYPSLKILILSSISDNISIKKILKKADGYIVKSESIATIIKGVESLNNGNRYISPQSLKIINQYIDSDVIILTKREKQVLHLIMEEKSSKEIALILNISQKTIEMHRGNLFVKLDVKNITGLVKKVISLDLLGN